MEAKEYRKDIDVLRAIAVLAVIFYHARIPFFSGGYVGVSIFFVISGYLITGIIKRKIANDSFSFLEFYENRIRRIAPALFFLLIVFFVIFALFGTSDIEVRFLRRLVKRVIFGISNFYLYSNTNYFDPAAELIPFLHTWSLAIEEQFYFIMPLLLVLLSKKFKSLYIYILILFFISFFSSIFLILFNQKVTFYMLPTRAWELLLGSLLAYTQWTPKSSQNKMLCIITGLALMLFPIIFYDTTTLFPGLWAFPPCFGAFLYIAGGINNNGLYTDNIFNKILYNKLFVFIGVISYSLYLWHWPVLVFFNFMIVDNQAVTLVLLLFIFLFSALSWKFIEQPFRKKAVFKNRKVLWTCFLTGFLTIFTLTDRISSPLELLQLNYTVPTNYAKYSKTAPFNYEPNKKQILLIGDSHAMVQTDLFNELCSKYDLSGTFIWTRPQNEKSQDESTLKAWNTLDSFIKSHTVDTVFLIYRFPSYLGDNNEHFSKNVLLKTKHNQTPKQAQYQELDRLINYLQANNIYNIFIQLPLPEPHGTVPIDVFKYRLFKMDPTKLAETKERYLVRTRTTMENILTLKENFPHIKLLNPCDYFITKDNYYKIIDNNTSYYHDDDHLSMEGVKLLYPLYDPIFKQIASEITKK